MKKKRNDIHEVFYQNGNVTACLLVENGEVVSRGLAVKSAFDKADDSELAISLASARAREAWGRKADCYPILPEAPRSTEEYDYLTLSFVRDLYGDYKGHYLPMLLPTERKVYSEYLKALIVEQAKELEMYLWKHGLEEFGKLAEKHCEFAELANRVKKEIMIQPRI